MKRKRDRQFRIVEPELSPFEQCMALLTALTQDEKFTLVKFITSNLGVRVFTQADVQKITQAALRMQLQKYHITETMPDGGQIITPASFRKGT